MQEGPIQLGSESGWACERPCILRLVSCIRVRGWVEFRLPNSDFRNLQNVVPPLLAESFHHFLDPLRFILRHDQHRIWRGDNYEIIDTNH